MSELKHFNLKDTTLDNCEHCKMSHHKAIQIEGYGEFKCRTMCDLCINSERRLIKINEVIQKTLILLRDTPANTKNSEIRAKLEKLLADQRQKQTNLIQETRSNLQGLKKQESGTRLPYKEN